MRKCVCLSSENEKKQKWRPSSPPPPPFFSLSLSSTAVLFFRVHTSSFHLPPNPPLLFAFPPPPPLLLPAAAPTPASSASAPLPSLGAFLLRAFPGDTLALAVATVASSSSSSVIEGMPAAPPAPPAASIFDSDRILDRIEAKVATRPATSVSVLPDPRATLLLREGVLASRSGLARSSRVIDWIIDS